jgi:Cation efflux family
VPPPEPPDTDQPATSGRGQPVVGVLARGYAFAVVSPRYFIVGGWIAGLVLAFLFLPRLGISASGGLPDLIPKHTRPADRDHPFGYGKERFFYFLLAAVGIFVAGAGFSVMEGVLTILHPGDSEGGSFLLKYAVLGAAFVFEGISLVRSVIQLRGEARPQGQNVLTHWRKSVDPTVKTVAVEDSAALVGLALAFGGVALHQVTGSSLPDAAASLAIGALLVAVAVVLIRADKHLLIGQAARKGPGLTAGRLAAAPPTAAGIQWAPSRRADSAIFPFICHAVPPSGGRQLFLPGHRGEHCRRPGPLTGLTAGRRWS